MDKKWPYAGAIGYRFLSDNLEAKRVVIVEAYNKESILASGLTQDEKEVFHERNTYIIGKTIFENKIDAYKYRLKTKTNALIIAAEELAKTKLLLTREEDTKEILALLENKDG